MNNKEIPVKSYTKADGTQVKAHIRGGSGIVNQAILDKGINWANENIKKWGDLNDAAQLWNISSSNLNDGFDYVQQNGEYIKQITDIKEHELMFQVAHKLRTQNIPTDGTKGILFNEDSTLSQNIANSKKFQQLVKDKYSEMVKGKIVNSSMEYTWKDDLNLWAGLKKCDVLNMKLDSEGNITATVLDTYDFNASETYPLVKAARTVQDAGRLTNYYTVTKIKIPKEQLQKYSIHK